MTTSELEARITQALAMDQALTAWALAHFNRPVTVLDDYDLHEPPSDESCPFIYFELLSHARGNNSPRKSWTYLLIVEIRVTDGSGRALASDLRELAEDCLLRPGLGKVEAGEDVQSVHEGTYWQNISTVSITQ